MSEPKGLVEEPVESKLNLPPEKTIYFNGFSCTLGAGDIAITLQVGTDPVAVLQVSYNVAKTLVVKLAGLIDLLEKGIESKILTTDEVATALMKLSRKE